MDLNTIISSIVLGMSIWTVKTVHDLKVAQSASKEHAEAQDSRIAESRSRIIAVEDKVGDLEVEVAKLEPRRR